MPNRDKTGPRGDGPQGQRKGMGSKYPRRPSAPGEGGQGQGRGAGSRFPRRPSAPGEGYQGQRRESGSRDFPRRPSAQPDMPSNKQLLERINACYELLAEMQKKLNQMSEIQPE